MTVRRSLGGAVAGGIAAAVWAAQQPLDKRVFESDYDDIELLGKLVTTEREWPAIGLALHIQNGAVFGAAYAQLKPFLPGPPVARALIVTMAEHFAAWPLARLTDRYHPARRQLPQLTGNRRALAQATWRHVLFATILGVVEQLVNDRSADEPPPIPVSSNGHGSLEQAVAPVA